MKKSIIPILITLMFCGCGRVITTDLGKVQIFNESEWMKASVYQGSIREIIISKLKKDIENYISKHPQIDLKIVESMRKLIIMKGMNQDQVLVLAGEPNDRVKRISNEETWVYNKDPNSFLIWNEGGTDLVFVNGILSKIRFKKLTVYFDM